MIPRKGETINTLPYGPATVVKNLDQGQVLVTVDRMLKAADGSISNQVIVELHPVWIAAKVVGGSESC